MRVINTVPVNTYSVETLEWLKLPKVLNGRYLKKYYTSVWQEA
jgi:hypothetical protein